MVHVRRALARRLIEAYTGKVLSKKRESQPGFPLPFKPWDFNSNAVISGVENLIHTTKNFTLLLVAFLGLVGFTGAAHCGCVHIRSDPSRLVGGRS